MRFFACSLVLSAVLASASAARADAVPPPPRNCPDGSVGETGHFGPYCRPLSCANDGECAVYGPGFTCQPTSLCIEIVEYTDWNGQTYQVETVTGTCAPDASCPPNAKCDDSPKCSTGASTTTSSSSGGSTSDAASGATTGPGPGPGAPVPRRGRAPTARSCRIEASSHGPEGAPSAPPSPGHLALLVAPACAAAPWS